jgi:hypothetical protein
MMMSDVVTECVVVFFVLNVLWKRWTTTTVVVAAVNPCIRCISWMRTKWMGTLIDGLFGLLCKGNLGKEKLRKNFMFTLYFYVCLVSDDR